MLEIRTEIISPAEAATLATSLETSILGDEAPVAGAVLGNVGGELVVFFRSPLSSLDVVLLTAGNPTHGEVFFKKGGK